MLAQKDTVTVDLLVAGAGTGMAAALAAAELGMSVLIVEKTPYIGGSTARSGGAFWIPCNPVLAGAGSLDSVSEARKYLQSLTGDTGAASRCEGFLSQGARAVAMLCRTTDLKFTWIAGYPDYHPEHPGGSVSGRACECRPFDINRLGPARAQLRPGVMQAPLPVPITSADYRWLNLAMRSPRKAIPPVTKRVVQGVGGLAMHRHYVAGGQALAAGLFSGVLRAGITIWRQTPLTELTVHRGRVTGAVVNHANHAITVVARRGVVLATGGFDHHTEWRDQFHYSSVSGSFSLGAEGNTGDGIRLAQSLGADITLMDQAWWFPTLAPLPDADPQVMLAERALPGSLIVDQTGERFTNEAVDYMSFGQRILERQRTGNPVTSIWLIFDQKYRNNYLLAARLLPRIPIPKSWYAAGIAQRGRDLSELASRIGVPEGRLLATVSRFNDMASTGYDRDFQRGASAYDRYYGDPTIAPNPNLRPLHGGPYYAVKLVLSDLGTCGGLRTDAKARVVRTDGGLIEGLYAVGNTAANTFSTTYPGAGATIGQALVFGYVAARHASRLPSRGLSARR